ALGSGISNIVYSLTNYNNNLIAGGLFTSAGLVPANNIASWNGTSWSALGAGMSGTFYQYVFALKTYNGDLIAGGYFTHSDGILTNGIAKWNGTAWSDMGGGLFEPGNVYGTHTLCLYGQDLVDGGLFNSAGNASNARNIASWNTKVLALNSIDLKAVRNNDAINITWQTNNESNKKSYELERSINALDFVGINTIPAKGISSSYSYTDKNPSDGINYYRIRENSINDNHTFSPVVKVTFNVSSIASLYPNPARNTVTVKGLNKNIITTIKISSMQGSEIFRQNYTQNSFATLNISTLPQGTYLIQVIEGSNVVGLKLVKE
ncbi:MAG: T9SS type A sorting domain-containing protein, partial [Ginsengibacter sp.]